MELDQEEEKNIFNRGMNYDEPVYLTETGMTSVPEPGAKRVGKSLQIKILEAKNKMIQAQIQAELKLFNGNRNIYI